MNKQLALKIVKAGKVELLKNGFTELPEKSWHDYTKESRAGKVELSIRMEENGPIERRYYGRGWNICIFAMFAEPDKARTAGIDCNPYSGKYNFLYIETIESMENSINQYR